MCLIYYMFLGKSKEDKLEGVPRIEQSKFCLIVIIRYIQDSVHCLVFNDLYTLNQDSRYK